MERKQILIDGLPVKIEAVGKSDYVSLTDLARHAAPDPPETLRSWLRNGATLLFLQAWEKMHNPAFKGGQMAAFLEAATDNRSAISPQRFIESTGAIGIFSKSGRGGGTWAHSDIALQFCYWLSPPFQVFFVKEFQRLKEIEADRKAQIWAAERVKDLLDEARNWMDLVEPPPIDRPTTSKKIEK